jgi:uncharacterized membrane protein
MSYKFRKPCYNQKIMILKYLFFIPFVFLSFISGVFAQSPIGDFDTATNVRAEVIEILATQEEGLGFDFGEQLFQQTIRARILEGDFEDSEIVLEQDYLGLEIGDTFIVEQYIGEEGPEYTLLDIDRRSGLRWLVLAFMVVILVFARGQGFRSLLSLGGSFLVIFYILVPMLLQGYPPILTTVILATAILALAIFLTHGFNKRSLIAFLGTVCTVFITGVLAYWVVNGLSLTGFESDEATFLDFNTGGRLDFVGLLLAGIIIGVLGVLDDISITQVAVVRELYSANPELTKWDVFTRALRVGKEHVAALVNTLVFAYVGVSLPLLLYVTTLGVTDVSLVVNSEIFATEITRTIIGSIGLILAVPLTTLAAAFLLENTKGVPLTEKEKHEGCAHSH